MRKGLGFHNRRSPGNYFTPAALFPSGTAGAWYDPSDASTLFSDTAGTTPSPTPGAGALSVVGLMLDKSQGLALGSETVVSPLAGSLGASYSIVGNTIVRNGSTGTAVLNAVGGVVPATSKIYLVTFTASGVTGDSTGIRVGGGTAYGPFAGDGTFTLRVAGGGTSGSITFLPWGGGAGTATYSNISVRELPGNHAISYNTTTARPELSARVNLLTYSEQFDNAAWAKTLVTVTANVAVAPDGTTTADSLTTNGIIPNNAYLTQTITASTGVFSLYAKASTAQYLVIAKGLYASGDLAIFDLVNGTITQTPTYSGSVATMTLVGNGWYRCVLNSTQSVTIVGITVSGAATGLSTGTSNSLLIWGADLRPANIGTSAPSYQRIADQYTYDSSGFPRYLAFNGTASGMYTPANLNLSATDKVTVFAGVRKLNAALIFGIISELSANWNSNSGSFYFGVEDNTWRYATGSRGSLGALSTQVAITTDAAYASPISNVLSSSNDIAGSTTTLKINGANINTATGAKGTGNFGSYPLYIGSRGNTGSWLNGYIYSLIVVGAASTAAQISSTESWINVKEGTVY